MNKKWILVIVVLILAVAGLVGYIVGRGGSNGEEQRLFPKIEEMGSLPKLTYVEPPEAKDKLRVEAQVGKEHWEKIGALSLVAKVENKTKDQTLVKAVFIYTLIDKSGKVIGLKDMAAGAGFNNIKPGEVGTLNLDMLVVANAERISRVEYSLRDIKFAVLTTPTIPATPTPTPPTATATQPAEQNVYTVAPKNPKEPAEIVAAFGFLCDQGKYDEATKLVTGNFLKEGDPRQTWSRISNGKKLTKMVVIDKGPKHTIGLASNLFDLEVRFCFEGGQTFDSNPWLIKESGVWKLDG